MKILLSEEMRALEAASDRLGVSYDQMMENAGRAVADFLTGLLPPEGVCLLLCGSGNNGGDGYVAARHLKERGFQAVIAAALGPPKTLSARRASEAAHHARVKLIDTVDAALLAQADVVVDALFGTNFHGDLPEAAVALARETARHRCLVAIDLPSGLRADSPLVEGESFHARHTLCLEAAKPACLMHPAAERCGALHILPIGPAPGAWEGLGPCGSALTMADAMELLPRRLATAHKGSFGTLLTFCGSSAFTGAAALSARAALTAGAGLVTLATTERVAAVVGASLWEATYLLLEGTREGQAAQSNLPRLLAQAEKSTALLAGCGLGQGEDLSRLIEGLLKDCACQLILDADALNALAGHLDWLCRAARPPILTPHVGEMARLTGLAVAEIKAQAPKLARQFAAEHRVVLVLKDASTIVAAPDGRLYIHVGGNAGLAKGGSGDLLAGMIASFVAQGVEAASAAAAGVTLHGAAGGRCARRLSRRGMLPHELLDDLRTIFLEHEQPA